MTRLNELTAIEPEYFMGWRAMAESAILNDAYAQGSMTLQNAISQARNPQVKRALLDYASTYVVKWYDTEFSRGDETKFKLGVQLLSQALNLQPRNPQALAAAVEHIATEPWSEAEVDWVVDVLKRPDAAQAVLQVLLGAHACLQDDEKGIEKARNYWSIAEAIDAEVSTVVLANIALALDRSTPENVQRIHNLLDLAISNSPSKDLYRYAKAYLLVELEDWSAARVLLEELVAAGNQQRAIITLLVRCVRALNDADAVAKYEKLLAEL
jgi:hypothetical protein